MKNSINIVKKCLVLPAIFLCFIATAQNCPAIVKEELITVSDDGSGNCTYRVDFTMTVDGSNKSIQVLVTCGGNLVLNECIIVSSTQNGTPFSTSTFACSCAAAKTFVINSFTTDNCGGSSCTTSGNTLPVNIISIQLVKRNNLPCLLWKVAGESRIENYRIEYSADGNNFTEAGSVTAVNNGLEHEYNFCDPAAKKNGFYRLKIISLSGEMKYSTVVRFTADTESSIEIYPNPANAMLNITMPLSGRYNNAGFEIYSSEGKLVLTGKLLYPSIDVSVLQKGVYSLRLKRGDEILATKNFMKN